MNERRTSRWRPRIPALLALALVLSAAPATMAAEQNDGDGSGSETAAENEQSDVDVPELEAPAGTTSPFRLALGPMGATRTMDFEGSSETISHRPPPYVGGRVEASGTLSRFEELGATLQLDTDLGYGVAKSDGALAPTRDALSTELMTAGVRLFLLRELANRLHAGFGAGVQATSVIVQPNPTYTGHRYIAAETGLRVQWRALPGLLTVVADAAAHPVFTTDNSDGAHGPGRAFGGRASGEFVWHLAPAATDSGLRKFRLVVAYRYQRYRSQFPRSSAGTGGAVGIDNQHIAALLFEYALPAVSGD